MFKSGFIGIVGRPNVGKSTLLNALMGEKLAIATHKPQTTRNRIMGIKNVPDGQMIFLDTPGIHKTSSPLNRSMVKTAVETFGNADLLLLLVEANTGVHKEDLFIIKSLENSRLPVILIINKIDLIEKTCLLPLIDQFRQLYHFIDIIPLSALKGDGVSILLDAVYRLLPEGPAFFPEDMITDRSERFIAAEIIREKIILLTHQEIPYVTAVMVDAFKEDEQKNLIHVQATIHVEKASQKGIIIGKKGAMLKQIGMAARKDLEIFFAAGIFLELFVRVQKDWTHDNKMLEEFGYIGKS
ncbi:MAG: GTPase Era [Deltaproteobacteria bacterium]|nr:GTPase Era [Deltaproteobacteria bacterium]